MMKRGLIIFAIAIVAGTLVALYVNRDTAQAPQNGRGDNIDTSMWQLFNSGEFDFSLRYPETGWTSATYPNDIIAPKFNFYLESSIADSPAPPFDHFANVTHVSVYPEGIPTEGLFAQNQALSEGWGSNVVPETSRIFTLEDGTPFAAYIKFQEIPDSWGEAGFAWVRLKIENWETICLKSGTEVPEGQCDPLGSPEPIEIIHRGDVDDSIWPTLREAVKSIQF